MSENKPDSSLSIKNGSKEQSSQLRPPTLSKISTYAATKVSQESRPDSMSRSSTSSRDHGTILTADTEQFIIGQKVWVGGVSPGQIAYIGETHFAPGEWAGIVLDEPNGKNDGCVSGKRYFQCEAKKGIFSRLTRLTLHPLEGAAAKQAQNYSPDRSRTVSPTPSTQSVLNRSMGGKQGLALGDRVIVSSGFGSRPGTLRFLGETQFASGNWCGIELDDSTGKNDGSVEGVKYFECKPKYGIFVPIAKVSLSPSSMKSRLSRAGSRESLTSVGTMNSIATTNTSRLRMKRYSMSVKQPTPSTTKSSFSMQDLLREKQNHIEQLMIERDMEQEDAQNQALQFQKIILELKSKIDSLEKNLDEEKNKTEDLKLSIEEANFCGDELNAQTQVYKEKITDLEQRLRAVTSGDANIQLPYDPVKNEIIVKTENTSTTESKYDINQQNNQYSFNQNEKSKLESLDATEALNDFRELLRKIKDSNSSDMTYQEELNRYIKDPDEICRIHSIKIPLSQMGDTFLRDLCESLALVIKEFNLMSIENKNTMAKCMDLENTLKNSSKEIGALENDKTDISKNLEEVKLNCKNLSEANEKLLNENKVFEETIKRLENEKSAGTEKLQDITSNCERFVGINEQLQRKLELQQENIEQIEKEKLSVSQKLEDVLSNCKSLSEINEKMQAELKNNAESSNLIKGEQLDVSRKFEDISLKCRSLSEQNETLLKDIQTSENKSLLLETQKLDVEEQNKEILTKLKNSSELNEKLQQELQVSEKQSSQFKKEIKDVSQKLEEMSMNCKSLSDANEKLREDLITSTERLRNMDEEQIGVHKKFEETTLICKNYEELNEKLQQELIANQEKSSLLETEKLDILQKLEEVQSTLKSTLEQNENLQQKQKTIEENSNLLEKENFELSRRFEEVSVSLKSSLEQNEKMQCDIRSNEEKLKLLEDTNLDISFKLKGVTSDYEILTDVKNKLQDEFLSKYEGNTSYCNKLMQQNEKLEHEIKSIEEQKKEVELEKLNILRKFEEATLNVKSISESNENQCQELQIISEKFKQLEIEKLDISQKLEESSSKYNSILKTKDELQDEFNSNKENTKRLEDEKIEISNELADLSSKFKSFSEENLNLQKQLKALEEKSKDGEAQMFELTENLKKITSDCEILTEQNTLMNNKLLEKDDIVKRLEEDKLNLSRKLEEVSYKNETLTELSNKLEYELETIQNTSKQLDVQNVDVSEKLESVTTNCKKLENINEKLHQDLKLINEKYIQNELEKTEILQKLNDITTNHKSLGEDFEKLKQELNKSEEKSNQLATEKVEISENLIDATLQISNLSDLSESLQQKFNIAEEKCRQLEGEKLEVFKKFEKLSEFNNKLEQDLKIFEEKINKLEAERLDVSGNLIDATLECKNLSELNEKLQQKLKENEEKCKQLALQKSESYQKLQNFNSESASSNELLNNIQKKLEAYEENNFRMHKENCELSEKLENINANCRNLSELNDQLQNDLKTKKEEIDRFKKEHSELIQNFERITANRDEISELYQKELNSRKLDDVSIKSENISQATSKMLDESDNLNAELSQEFPEQNISNIVALIQSVKSVLETEYFRDALRNNDTLRCFSQSICKIEAEINNDQQSNVDAINSTVDASINPLLSNDSISKIPSHLIENSKAHQNVPNEFIISRLHLGKQLQDIYQLINSIKSHIENLDEDIQSIPSENKIRTDMLNAAEEKSCKLQYDFTDLVRRFEALVMINEKYPDLKDSISKSLLDQAKKNIEEKEACMEFDPSDEIELLQNIVINYQLVLKAYDVEIASNLIAKSSHEPLSTGKRSDKSVQSDLELTRSFINKLDELNFVLKRLRCFQLKISKHNVKINANFNNLKNDKDSLEDICKVTLQLRHAEKELKAECLELKKILVNSMQSFENSRQSLDKSTISKSQHNNPISHIDKSMETINNVINSNSDLLNLLCEKVKIFDEKSTNLSSKPLVPDNSRLDSNTKTELKSENVDEKTAQINFLHSIIADMQQKNDKLKDKIETLEAFSTDNKKSFMYQMIAERKRTPRMFCDNCDQFDLHEKEDCPIKESDEEVSFEPDERVKEESDGNSMKKLSAARKYCENCEAFGDHETEDCYAGLE